MAWADHGSCVTDYGIRFGTMPPEAQQVVCAGCPVRSECLEDALADERLSGLLPAGIRGGMSARGRAAILKAERRQAAAA